MSKTRVYELAREFGMESKVLVTKLQEMGIQVASHQSTLTDAQTEEIKKAFGKDEKPASAPKVIRRRRVARKAGDAEAAESADESDSGDESMASEAAESSESLGVEAAAQAESEESEGSEGIGEKDAQSAEAPADPSLSPTMARDLGLTPLMTKPAQVVSDSEPAAESVSDDMAVARSDAEPEGVAVEASMVGESEVETTKGREGAASGKSEESVAKQPQSSGGATIVRRATPAEVASSQAASQRSQDRRGPPIKRPPPRQDSQYSGGGSSASSSAGGAWEVPSEEGGRGGRIPGRKTHAKAAGSPVEESSDFRKAPVAKNRRDAVSTRTLMEMAVTGEDETFIGRDGRRKTVYTPVAQNRKRDLKRRKDLKKTQITTPRAAYRIVKMGDEISVSELGRQMGVKGAEIIKKLMTQGIMVTLNQPIDFDTASLLASEYAYEVENNKVTVDDIISKSRTDKDDARDLQERAPIVTIMGHVDHGKTSILDAIRKAKVAEGESGGITQHIGAYTVSKDGKSVAFLDTPGHEAFSAMRQRGAKVTDIVVLVVAADDGVKPQTIEAISHAKAADVPIIVAINKMDKPNINLDRVFNELMEHGIQSEEWGGETQFVKVSALKGTGLDDLLDAISLQAEVLELKAHFEGEAYGVVVEAHLDQSRGPVATVMIQDGVAQIGEVIVAGSTYGKVRAMNDDAGHRVDAAGPSTPVEIIGLESVPMAGDSVHVVKSEKIAKEIADFRKYEAAQAEGTRSSAATLESLLGKVASGERPEVSLILKADTQGSIEAMIQSLNKLNSDKVHNKVIHRAVGGITESDIRLAATSGAVIIGFNVRMGRGVQELTDRSGVPVKYFSVIYDVVDAVKNMMAGKLPPIQTEVVQGHAEVRQTIKVPKIGMVAGTAVLDGKIVRNSHLRLIRDDVVIFEGKIASLRRFKDDVKEVATGYECGIGIEGCNDIKEGDLIEAFTIEETAATL